MLISCSQFADMRPVVDVPDAETQFDIDEFNDLYAKTKPTLYIKMADIFSIHHLIAGETQCICPNQDDILRDVIRELGSAKNNENDFMSVRTSEICLTLNPKLHDVEGLSTFCNGKPNTANTRYRSRRRDQGFVHGNQTMHSVHNPCAGWYQPHGNHGKAHYYRRPRTLE